MADVHDSTTRSINMSRIKNADTEPELQVRKFLHAKGFRFRLHRKDLVGKPDICLSRYKTLIFINGCFWHGHKNCKYFALPKINQQWWRQKIEATIKRDSAHHEALIHLGWTIMIIWECELKWHSLPETLQMIEIKLKQALANE